MGDKPTGSLSHAYWATSDRRSILWAVINKLIEDTAKDGAKTSSEEKTSSKASKGERP
jgi:hypothetical protein